MQKVNTEVGNKNFTTQKRTPRLIPTARPPFIAQQEERKKGLGPLFCVVGLRGPVSRQLLPGRREGALTRWILAK